MHVDVRVLRGQASADNDLYIGNLHPTVNEDLVALWKVWIPSTLLNFAFMPMWARIPWVASTSLIWTCILSAMRGSSEVPGPGQYAPKEANLTASPRYRRGRPPRR